MGMLRWFALLCFAALAWGAKPPAVLAGLAERAHSAPPEFAADALLRIAAAPQATDDAWKRRLIEDAFRLAAGARQPYARRAWRSFPGSLLDKVYAQDLDGCSLQCRAVRAMLTLDRKKARELFEELPAPQIPRLSCEDALVYDVSAFYDTLAEIAQQTFSPKEIADQEPAHFLERYVSGLGSPAEIGPVAHLLAGAALPAPQFEALSAAYASALKQFAADGRSFSATISGQATAAAVEELAAAGARKGINSLPVLDAWRSYLVRHLTGTVCADTLSAASAGMSFGMTAGSAANEQAYSGAAGAVRYFNENMRTGALPPISGDEAQPAKQEGQAHAAGLCASEECRRLGEQFGGLVLGPIGIAISSEQKSSGDWTAKLKDYLAALASWQGSDDPAEGFLWKSRFYQYALGVAPDGQTRDMVLSAFLGWLQLNEYQREHPVEWFYPVNALIVRAFADPLAMKTTVRELRNSADPVIALYAELEQALPRPADRAAPLL